MDPIRPFAAALALLVACCGAGRADEGLPRALILGDTVYHNTSRVVASELDGRVEVVWKHPGSTGEALAGLDELLGDEGWDVILFNFGLADLVHRDPSTEAIRVMSRHAGGVRASSPERYRHNLERLVEALGATGARLIWANTTPIVKSDHLYVAGSEIESNGIAAEIMAERGIPVVDMHSYVTALLEGERGGIPLIPQRAELHPPIVENILSVLSLETAGQ